MPKLEKHRILILGASGMLGSTLFRAFSADENMVTFGTLRDSRKAKNFRPVLQASLISGVDMDSETSLLTAFSTAEPDVVINCVGIIKQQPNANDHLDALATNAVLPHRLAKYCSALGARLIHFSTDCIFSGKAGNYDEDDTPDAQDLYGRTKFLGEVGYGNAVTLRTSIIGHELGSTRSLVDWFLSQTSEIKGFRKAIFSGIPTVEVARVVKDLIIPNPEIAGLYHLSVDPINKLDLLQLIADIYKKNITITPDDTLVIDRTLASEPFRKATGFAPKPWVELIRNMHEDYLQTKSDVI